MYLVTTTFTKIDHLTKEEAIALALKVRGEGKRSELIFSHHNERARVLGLHQPMQDLTKL
jgi:hypothetical protein